jgi:acrylyl-CoA reductase (NADPH)
MTDFRALIISEQQGNYRTELGRRQHSELRPNEVLIRVRYSSLNYKDALSSVGNKAVTRQYPHTPGIDAAGEVVESADDRFKVGDAVVVFGYDLGMNTAGGLAEYVRVPAAWVLPLPPGLDARSAMAYGTAGITAALSVMRLEHNGLMSPASVLVTGASGGVGSMSVLFLGHRGYRITAVTGKESVRERLSELGVSEFMPREAFSGEVKKPLLKPQFSAAIDCVGGMTLANVLKVIYHSGAVACSGLVQSPNLPTTVFPFILRGVSLLGVDSVELALERKREAWDWIAANHDPVNLAKLVREITLAEAPEVLAGMLGGSAMGRCVVNIDG